MTGLRKVLTEQLTRSLDRHQVVVWSDPHGEYRDVAADLAPQNVTFESYHGSWYELLRRIEPEYSRPEPRLVVYVDAEAPGEDPLAELRAAGTTYTRRLSRLLRQAMEGDFAATKLDDIAATATTLTEAEALLEGSVDGSPAKLVKALGNYEPNELVLNIATAPRTILDDAELFGEALQFLDSHLGVSPRKSGDLGGAIARHLVLVELASVIGELPVGLQSAYRSASAEQSRRCKAVLDRWKHDQRLVSSFEEMMSRASDDLGIPSQLAWNDALK